MRIRSFFGIRRGQTIALFSFSFSKGFGSLPASSGMIRHFVPVNHFFTTGRLRLEKRCREFRSSVYLNNYAPASGVNAPISSTYGCFGSNCVAQLYRGSAPVGDPIPLLASAGATYVDPKF